MAFYVDKDKGERPADAIHVRNDKVGQFYRIVVDTWDNKSEIWALAYGGKVLGLAGALSGMYGNAYFRRKLRLKNYGFFSTYLPNMALPFLITASFHESYIQKDIFVDPLGCSLCKGTRAAAVQVIFGLIQPLVLVPASSFMFATRHFTLRIPSPIRDRKDFLKFCRKMFIPLKVPMGINVALQTLLAFFITHMEENHFFYLQQAIIKPDTEQNVATEEV
ncbi:uncharacterized protein LOC129566171 [Sitodiplosis mosellana]|uniref:uncharacterized protein LOC129566171 n=1 Tax=Sitodiplosis mosellana TaxID=263140 RepID=UPI002443C445|nr:uncharacterized protein LOC129566171 [Sitodiplosis mosellana]XP_055297849.1 uncharacterized protein LOC129566171 [Sitodiplosis mosellana]